MCSRRYSERMKQLIKDPEGFFKPDRRPSGHDVTGRIGKDNGGAIPSNLLQYPNTESNSIHIRLCKAMGIPPHPARFPRALPEFFIKFLTDPGDTVMDIFAGSNTTGEAAEALRPELDRARVRPRLRDWVRIPFHGPSDRRRSG